MKLESFILSVEKLIEYIVQTNIETDDTAFQCLISDVNGFLQEFGKNSGKLLTTREQLINYLETLEEIPEIQIVLRLLGNMTDEMYYQVISL